MELSVKYQLFQLACSWLAGLASGVIYDLFRVLRRRVKASAMFDVLFWFAMLLILFTLGMDVGEGSLHIFMLAFTALGFVSYMILFSAAVFALFNKIAQLIEAVLSPVKKLLEKFLQVVKNLFSKAKSRFRMKITTDRKGRRKAFEELPRNNGDNSDSASCVRYPEPRRRAEGP